MSDLPRKKSSRIVSRRNFVKQSSLLVSGAALAGTVSVARGAHAAGSDLIKIALIGSGRRGCGATVNALNNASYPNVKLWAMADAFAERLDFSYAQIRKRCPDQVDVPTERRFVGLDAYQKALESGADLVLLCEPPGFRPLHYEAAVRAGKHVFMEKPLATDAPGYRRLLAANAEAKKKGLAVAVGHHLRHEDKHRLLIKKIHDGVLGRLNFLRVYFTISAIWVRPRKPQEAEMEYQIRNWYHFTWLSGDHIVEQHVHDLDVGNWIAQAHPIEAQGLGGRQVCTGKDQGEIFDHHAVEFTYPNGLKMFSYCRQIDGCWNSNAQHVHGAKGVADLIGQGTTRLHVEGEKPVKYRRNADGHQVEMDDLFAALAASKPYHEGDWAAESTMTAILGRMASYSGNLVSWDDAVKSELNLYPPQVAWGAAPTVRPGPDGHYPCALPGITKAW